MAFFGESYISLRCCELASSALCWTAQQNMCVCQQGISDMELPMTKRQRIDLGHESDMATRDFADPEMRMRK